MTLANDIAQGLLQPSVGMSEVVIRQGALTELAGIVEAFRGTGRIAYLHDDVPFRTSADANVKDAVKLILDQLAAVDEVVLSGAVHADESTVDYAIKGCADADIVVTFGSGTISDIGKVAAAHSRARHVIVQSAVSVNGYADDQSVLLINGAKRTTHSAWPDALVVDIDVVSGAPAELNASGLGDMISMFTAPADWYLSSLFELDRGWSNPVATLTRRHGDQLLAIASGIGDGEPSALETLAEFVTLSGISMGIAGQTSPSSGMEHTISHMIDMAKGARGESTALHGAQVGIATAVSSILWRRMMRRLASGEVTNFRIMDDSEAREKIDEAFGWMDSAHATAAECWADYSKKLHHLRSLDTDALITGIQREWERHSAELESLVVEPERIVEALSAAGAPCRFSQLGNPPSRDDVVWALSNCHLMRNRFTLADLAFATGFWDENEVESVLEEAEQIGSGV